MKLNLLLCAIEILGLIYVAMFERRAALKVRCNAVVRHAHRRNITGARLLMIASLAASVVTLARQFAELTARDEDMLACLPFYIYALAWLRFESLTDIGLQAMKRHGKAIYSLGRKQR